MKIKKSAKSLKKPLVVTVLAITLLVGGYVAVAYTQQIWPFADDTGDTSTEIRDVNDVDYGPPTEQETEDSQNAKERILEESDDNESNSETSANNASESDDKQAAVVGVSYAGIYEDSLEIRAFTSSVIQGSGTCTASISKSGAETITEQSSAFIDASSTICEPIFVPKSQLSSGTWNVNVNYSSPSHEGSSGAMKVEVK